jgi:predicted HicB family RNase H-like nuclease
MKDGMVRVSGELVQSLKIECARQGKSIKQFVSELINKKLNQNKWGRDNYGKSSR